MSDLTHNIPVIIEWNGENWDLFFPDEELSMSNSGPFPKGPRHRCAATLHIPIAGKEKPFVTTSTPEFRNPEVDGWTV